ncbi:MAG: LytTR family DNA-binding domain-containing protein [Bacteroidota bacterium]|nr:LytTR family DNA-binding domain-containing protein [Bacteroidota bacterium]
MNKLNCVIIDDEIAGRIVLKELLGMYFENVSIAGEASNISEGFDIINTTKPDLVFLDIQMPGGDGFDLLKKFDTITFEVIFVTSHDKYAINAIKFSALDFLLKPVDVEELKTSVAKVFNKKNLIDQTSLLISNLLRNINSEVQDKKLAVHVLDKVKLLDIKEVICIEASGAYSDIYYTDRQKYTTPKLLKVLEEFLEGNENFIRVSKSALINAKHVTSYTKGAVCILSLSNNKQYEISRRRKIEINAILAKALK